MASNDSSPAVSPVSIPTPPPVPPTATTTDTVMQDVPVRAPQTGDEARTLLEQARMAVKLAIEHVWTATNEATRLEAEQLAEQAERRFGVLLRMAQVQFPELAPTQDFGADDFGTLPANFKAYNKLETHPARFLDDFAAAATRTCRRHPAEQYHFVRMLAVIEDPALRAFVDGHIVKPGLDWRSGKQLFLRREMEPAAHIKFALRPLKMEPIRTPGSADSVESFAERWVSEIEAMQVSRNSLLAKLLFAHHLRFMETALIETIAKIKALRFAVPPKAVQDEKTPLPTEKSNSVAPNKDRIGKGCEHCHQEGMPFWKGHSKEKCFFLHPELKGRPGPKVLLQQFQELEQENSGGQEESRRSSHKTTGK
ncbi:hypothetical protein RI367_003125 [Sorochytrium milnesiophthora]